MPFTFAHPAIVLPLSRFKKIVCLSSLIIGSMAPDFEYFIRMKIKSDYGHDFLGLFWFNLPLVIIACFIFHLIVRNVLIDNLPEVLRKRFVVYKAMNWREYFNKHFVVVISSALLGIFSHILWDSFTHKSGFFVQQFKFLSLNIKLLEFSISMLKIFQHSSTLVGFLFISYFIFKLPVISDNTKERNHKLLYWSCIFFVILLVLFFRIIISSNNISLGNIIATLISGMVISFVFVSSLFMIFSTKK